MYNKGKMLEKDLQAQIIKWLRSQHCVVLKYQQNATTRAGVPDIFFVKEQFWGAIEVKKTKSSPFRPGQRAMVDKLDSWSWAKVVWGGKNSNWPEVRGELGELLK